MTAMGARRHSRAALVLALVPFAAMCFSVALWDRVRPWVLGLPFNLFWLSAWIIASSLILSVAYRLEVRHGHRDEQGG
jgi:hypothetical protein